MLTAGQRGFTLRALKGLNLGDRIWERMKHAELANITNLPKKAHPEIVASMLPAQIFQKSARNIGVVNMNLKVLKKGNENLKSL